MQHRLLALLTAAIGPLCVLPLLSGAEPHGDATSRQETTPPPLEAAREALEDDDPETAAGLLFDWLAYQEGEPDVRVVLGEALAELDRDDEAAHQLELALERGTLDDRVARKALKLLRKLDPLARERTRLEEDVVETLAEIAADLEDGGHDERALELAERVRPYAVDDRVVRDLDTLIAALRARREEVRLDGDADRGDEDVLPLFEYESERYRIEAHLEPDVVERLGATMDQVFAFYVQVYMDDDEGRVDGRKATITIHPDRATMLGEWTDPDRSPGGWWSPGEWRVVCYDTRSDGATLDGMLETLFHEASHQFMTMVVSGGGSAPSWLNEGTASFFEGTRAMADGRVLWPDVAGGRLFSLRSMLTSDDAPTLQEVVSYDEAGSYPGDHYAFGWGLIYYLQEYEDPASLAKVWRPTYSEIVARASRGARSSRALFDEHVLAEDNPGGFESMAAFEADWRRWILEEIAPLHSTRTPDPSDPTRLVDQREPRRRARLARYIEAAEIASKEKRPAVSEDELLDRALGEIAALRGLFEARAGARAERQVANAAVNASPLAVDATEEAELLLQEADVLQRRGRDPSAAAALERVLDLAADGRYALDEDAREDLERRMLRLDRGNAPVRQLRLRTEGLRKRTERLLTRYSAGDDDTWLLRARGLAEAAARLLDDDRLRRRADALRARAIEAGRVLPRTLDVVGSGPVDESWPTIFSAQEERFDANRARVRLDMPGRIAGRICTDLLLIPEYTVRTTLVPEGERYRSSYHGLVVAGGPDDVWYAVGVGGGRDLVVKRVERRPGGATRLRNVLKLPLARDLRSADSWPLTVVVRADGLTVRLGEGDAAPVEVDLPEPLPLRSSVGILVKDAGLTLEGLRVEFLP